MVLPVKDERVELRVPAEDVALWRAAAERERMTLSDWIRRVCTKAIDAGVAEHVAARPAKRRTKIGAR
jgi:uncharacterized protein (DUF1778 family)